VQIAPQPYSTFYLIQIPLVGRARVFMKGHEVYQDEYTATVADPDSAPTMHWRDSRTAQLLVRIDREALNRQLGRMLGRPPENRLAFATAMDLRSAEAQSWLNTIDLMRRDAEGVEMLRLPAVAQHIAQLVMSQLLMTQPNDWSEELSAAPGDCLLITPRPIRRAEELIVRNARGPLAIEDIAETVGVSVRSLQEGFRRFLDTTPSARLREARLCGVRAELAAADPTTTSVTEIATQWGFWHLGRFSVTYRERWGVSPSTTLRS
jgi:AraC-like DNA-binding protein